MRLVESQAMVGEGRGAGLESPTLPPAQTGLGALEPAGLRRGLSWDPGVWVPHVNNPFYVAPIPENKGLQLGSGADGTGIAYGLDRRQCRQRAQHGPEQRAAPESCRVCSRSWGELVAGDGGRG